MSNTEELFASLIEEHSGSLKVYALRLSSTEEDAEDLFQVSCLKAWRFFDKFEIGTDFKSWFGRIQYNTFINLYNRKKLEFCRLNSIKYGHVDYYSPSESANPEKEMVEACLSPVVQEALDNLNPLFRDVMLLRADGKEYSEISEELGIVIGTTMSRLYRARMALQVDLKDHWESYQADVWDAAIHNRKFYTDERAHG